MVFHPAEGAATAGYPQASKTFKDILSEIEAEGLSIFTCTRTMGKPVGFLEEVLDYVKWGARSCRPLILGICTLSGGKCSVNLLCRNS